MVERRCVCFRPDLKTKRSRVGPPLSEERSMQSDENLLTNTM